MQLDLTQPKHAHIDRRLRDEPILWMATTRPDGRPHLIPVWFLWDGATILIFSQPDNQKVRNLRANPNITVALEAADEGEDIAIFEGTAELLDLDGSLTADALPDYVAKYGTLIAELGWEPATMAASYRQPIRITPTRLITW